MHRVHRYVPMVVWKWTLVALVVLFWALMAKGIWWQGLVVDALAIGGQLAVGRLPPGSGLRAVEVRPEGLRLRYADVPGSVVFGWADILDVAHVAGRVEDRRIGAGRGQVTVHHAAVALMVRDQPEPLVLVHVRRPQQLAVSIATHVARTRARAAGTERRDAGREPPGDG
ncbi:hypothetical protein ACH4E7_27690 [Kitasatospora sp. NPDC018058]|uniref:hypothetical protein n=1 Tax=Kitasatospora sp. NPDC018058 TaxID=3364025 RepID=UPI0037BE59DE